MKLFFNLKTKRIAVGVICVMTFIFVLFSVFYVAAESEHDCSHEDCPICVLLVQCENTLRKMGDRLFVHNTAAFSVFFILILANSYFYEHTEGTLVSKKVRLNN